MLLAASPLILQALPQERVDFAIGDQPYRGPAEYTRVETALAPHLRSVEDLGCLGVPEVLILAREAELENSYRRLLRRRLDAGPRSSTRRPPCSTDCCAGTSRPAWTRCWPARCPGCGPRWRRPKLRTSSDLPLTDALRTRLSDVQQTLPRQAGASLRAVAEHHHARYRAASGVHAKAHRRRPDR